MVVMMVGVASTLRLADLLHVQLDGGEIGLRGVQVAGLQILGELGDGSRQRVILRGGSDCKVLRISGEKRLQGGEIGLRLGEVAGLQILRELLKTLLELVRIAVRDESVKLGNDGVGDAKNGHTSLLIYGPDGGAPGTAQRRIGKFAARLGDEKRFVAN